MTDGSENDVRSSTNDTNAPLSRTGTRAVRAA
jgi:hypothetical protein